MPGTGLDIGNIVLNETKSLIWWLLILRGKNIYIFFSRQTMSVSWLWYCTTVLQDDMKARKYKLESYHSKIKQRHVLGDDRWASKDWLVRGGLPEEVMVKLNEGRQPPGPGHARNVTVWLGYWISPQPFQCQWYLKLWGQKSKVGDSTGVSCLLCGIFSSQLLQSTGVAECGAR